MRGGARGAPLGVGRSITPPRQTGEHATQPLHSLLERPTSARQNRVTFSASDLLRSGAALCFRKRRLGSELDGEQRRRFRNLMDLSNGKDPTEIGGGGGGWGGRGRGRAITSVNHVRVDQSDLSPQLAALFLAARRHSSDHKLLWNEVRQCRPPKKKHLCFHFYVVILM